MCEEGEDDDVEEEDEEDEEEKEEEEEEEEEEEGLGWGFETLFAREVCFLLSVFISKASASAFFLVIVFTTTVSYCLQIYKIAG